VSVFFLFFFFFYFSFVDVEEIVIRKNICLEEITKLANNSMAWRLVQLYGDKLTTKRKMTHEYMQELRKESVGDKEYLDVYDNSFIEASWCHRNAQWVTYLFVGEEIHHPLKLNEINHPLRLLRDIAADITHNIFNGVYLCTIPRFLKEDDTPRNFFYRTHWFVIQVVHECEIESPCFRIYAGFARHYRMIDYLSPWQVQDHVPLSHPLKIDHSLYAGVDMTFDTLSEFLRKTSVMIDEINFTLTWGKMVNDLHKELFFADKFADMIEMYKLENKKKGAVEKIEDFNYEEGIFDIKLVKDRSLDEQGGYHLICRKYFYDEKNCAENALMMRNVAYGKHDQPAKPLKISEDYGVLY